MIKEIGMVIIWTLGLLVAQLAAIFPLSFAFLFDTQLPNPIVAILSITLGSIFGWLVFPPVISFTEKSRFYQRHPIVAWCCGVTIFILTGIVASLIYANIFLVDTSEDEESTFVPVTGGIIAGILLRSFYEKEKRPKNQNQKSQKDWEKIYPMGPLEYEVLEYVKKHKSFTPDEIQEPFKIGYAKATRVIDTLYVHGYVDQMAFYWQKGKIRYIGE